MLCAVSLSRFMIADAIHGTTAAAIFVRLPHVLQARSIGQRQYIAFEEAKSYQ